MASTTVGLTNEAGPLVPGRGTMSAAANQLFPRKTIVTRDSSGNAVSPSSADASGLNAMGVSNATYDNRTGSEAGGLAGDLDVELDFGVHAFAFTGTTPLPGQVMYVVDNQTVNQDSDSGQRGIAGYCSEVRVDSVGQTVCYVLMGPTVVAQIVIAASEASQLDTAQTDIDALQADALTAQAVIPIPLSTFRTYSTGAVILPFVANTTDGIDPTAESIGMRWNDDSTVKIAAEVIMPADLDDTAAVVFHCLGYRVGSTDSSGVALTVGAFFREAGAAFSADADAGGDTTTFVAATTVVSEETLSLAAGDVPVSPSSLLLTLVPNASLDDDDLVIIGCWLEYTRKLLTS